MSKNVLLAGFSLLAFMGGNAYADHLVAMRAGAVYAAGAPEAVMVPQTLRAVFGLESTVIGDPVSGRPMMIPHSRAAL